MKNEKGFTLIEMLIVLLVISILLIITIPNITKHNDNINNKGCEAFIKMVQAQVQAYEIEHKVYPQSVKDLISKGYLNEKEDKCPNGKEVIITNGVAAVKEGSS
ncbi:competence type IV pilus major pilin ComGC [Bacillus methanolicus]|uniref:ComG operon protein 3 n=1 Tax=Bacillus methanolicus (strain MGA3 / ATCC 53907) TaxID=796606 RepID=I3EAF6_BACMM|nr:competence type IV pilus major pilin ComGC [Bacillus methanolicus]AIE60717.1 competence protein ComGC [Bacillus methanolicus MGA3]EIJ83477.1 Competence protein ComGC [Bacillus methanolicus MGA3]UQD52728.1 prepilin-type N-terminal cleavage/methylation domain-containing protein [Bacillus methanolicus]